MFVSLEMDTGEGFVFFVPNVSKEIPVHHRWYWSAEGGFEDPLGRELYLQTVDNPRVDDLLAGSTGLVMSVQCVEAREQSEDLQGMTWEEGVQWALDNNFLIRKVMEDGKGFIVTLDLNMNRWSCHLAHGKIYRAERY